MINFDGKEMQEEFNKAFGNLLIDDREGSTVESFTIEDLTGEQLWWLVKFAKHIRGRCRSNTALNNYLNRNFPNASFREVPKSYNGKSYVGLKIIVNEKDFEQESSEE